MSRLTWAKMNLFPNTDIWCIINGAWLRYFYVFSVSSYLFCSLSLIVKVKINIYIWILKKIFWIPTYLPRFVPNMVFLRLSYFFLETPPCQTLCISPVNVQMWSSSLPHFQVFQLIMVIFELLKCTIPKHQMYTEPW